MIRKRKSEKEPTFWDAGGGGGSEEGVALPEAARERYLNYALSVITSRALPDVRDGLKPVQRRILFTMGQSGMRADTKHRKCAKVVGDVMGSYHPHGDSAIYEALVRMAQPFSLRMPLVDGSGNFGSLDGDGAAAMRYTECRLAPEAEQLLGEIGQQTVDFRPNYDGTRSEPVVLPARMPNLLINGSTGIAVGMATNIPPHNPIEVCEALLKLLKNRSLSSHQLCKAVLGPDFPTGGQILNSPEELLAIYEEGSGAVRLRGTTEKGKKGRSGKTLFITSIPYALQKSTLVERIADVIAARKLPPLLDVRDLSGEEVRIELLLKSDADEQMVLAYLHKHTPLHADFNVNLTCLVPTGLADVGRPERCSLKNILGHFLTFRMEVVTRRLENELEGLRRRIHLLDGFAKVFDVLDEILAIVRASDGKEDAAKQIIARYKLDEEQTDAILELKIYRLAKLEIHVVLDERKKKKARAAEIRALLEDEDARWELVGGELATLRDHFRAQKIFARRTLIESVVDEPEFSAEDFIIDEDNVVLVTRDGWVKRQKEVKDLARTKVREGDRILAAEPGSTREPIVFFGSFGSAYTCRIADIPATTGHGDPIQSRFNLKDGERIVAALSLDPRRIGSIQPPSADEPAPVHAFAATSDGYSLRFSLAAFAEPSTKNGRRYARLKGDAEIVGVVPLSGDETIIAASRNARAILCPASEVNYLAGPGKGVLLIKLQKEDRLLGFIASRGERDLLVVATNRGAEKTVSSAKYEVTGRGGKGREIQKTGYFDRVVERDVPPPDPLA
ncbi:MAG: DNA topoisomerase 4 subunit A [Planctomycetes bacterium]|nr:DNA topoisomerase 4 subunit A [Planctomycetota bacterium]